MEQLAARDFITSFFEKNSEYVEIKTAKESAHVEVKDIDELDDELWILQTPKGTDITELQGQKVKLPGRSHLSNLEAVAVEFESPQRQSIGYCNNKGKYAIRLLPINGSILLRNRLKANHFPSTEEIASSYPSMGRVSFPDNIKVRHPLLGAQFKEKLELNKSVIESLRSAQKKCNTISRKRQRDANKLPLEFKKPAKMYSMKNAEKNETTFIDSVANKSLKKEPCTDSEVVQDDVEITPRRKEKKSKKTKVLATNHEDLSENLEWLKAL